MIHLNSLEEIYIIPNKNEINILLVELLDKNDKEDKKKDILFSEIINQPIAYLPFAGSGLKIILKTDATLIDLFELKDNDSLDNMILNTTFNIEGLTLKSQIFVSLLVLLLKSLNPNDKIRAKIFNLVNDIVLTIINGNTSYKIMNKEMFDDYENDKEKLILSLKQMSYECVNIFKDPKFRVFQKVNFNKMKIGILGSPKFKVGFGFNFESPKNNEFIDKVLNDTIEIEIK